MRLALLVLGAFLSAGPAAGPRLAGTWVLKRGDAALTLVLEQTGGRIGGTLSSSDGTRLALDGTIEEGEATGTCTGAGGQVMFEAALDGTKLVLTLVDLGGGAPTARSLEFERTAAAARAPAASEALDGRASARAGAPARVPPVEPAPTPGDGGLIAYFAGEYYSFTSGGTVYGSGGTERTLTLCPDGGYRDSYESGAYGEGWGSAAQRAGGGRWSMQGDRQRGVLRLVSAGGSVRQVRYQVVERGTLRLDGVTFAYAGKPRCR